MLKHTLGHDGWGMNSCSHGNRPRPGPHIKETPDTWNHADPDARCAAWLDQPWKRPCPSAICTRWSLGVQDAWERAINAGKNAARLVPYKVTVKSCVQMSHLPAPKGSTKPPPVRLGPQDFTSAPHSLLTRHQRWEAFRKLFPREVSFITKLHWLLILYLYTMNEMHKENVYMQRENTYIDKSVSI